MSTSTTRRSRIARGTLIAAAGALAVGLLPSIDASAAGSTPSFSYIDCANKDSQTCDQILRSNDSVGSSGTAVALTPTADHYQTYSYDMSADGDSWVAGLRHGPVLDDGFDSTTGLVLVHRGTASGSPAKVTSRVLTTSWDATPVISADGRTVWWLGGDVLHKFVATYDEATGAISGTTTTVAAPLFAAAPLETAWNLAVSPDGLSAAVLFHNDDYDTSAPPVLVTHRDRVVAAKLGATVAGDIFFEKKYDTSTVTKTAPSANTFTFVDNSTLAFDEYTFTAGAGTGAMTAVLAAIPTAKPHTTAVTTNAALNDFYDVRKIDTTWWAWKDRTVSGTFAASALSSTSDVAVAPTPDPGTDRSDGDHTYRYIPTVTTPPVMTYASNRAVAHPHLVLSSRSVLTGKRPAYWGYNLYLQPAVGAAYADADADEIDRGVLHWQGYGETVEHTLATSGATAFQAGLATYLGYTPPLTRNTYFWWSYPGDYITRPGTTTKLLVTVVPKVTVKVTAPGARRTVYGSVTRRRGGVVLYKVVGTKLTKVATAGIATTGAYSFGRRVLAKGTYRVVSVADAGWAAAASINFRI